IDEDVDAGVIRHDLRYRRARLRGPERDGDRVTAKHTSGLIETPTSAALAIPDPRRDLVPGLVAKVAAPVLQMCAGWTALDAYEAQGLPLGAPPDLCMSRNPSARARCGRADVNSARILNGG